MIQLFMLKDDDVFSVDFNISISANKDEWTPVSTNVGYELPKDNSGEWFFFNHRKYNI